MFERRLLGGLKSSGLQYGMTTNQSFFNMGLKREIFKVNQINKQSIERSQKLSIVAQMRNIFGANTQVRFFSSEAKGAASSEQTAEQKVSSKLNLSHKYMFVISVPCSLCCANSYYLITVLQRSRDPS